MYNKTFKLKSNQKKKNGNMGDPAPNDGEIPPDQAAQLPGADEENHAPAIVAQPAMAVQAVSVANYQVHRQRNLASNQKIGHVEFGALKDFEKRLVSIKKAARTK